MNHWAVVFWEPSLNDPDSAHGHYVGRFFLTNNKRCKNCFGSWAVLLPRKNCSRIRIPRRVRVSNDDPAEDYFVTKQSKSSEAKSAFHAAIALYKFSTRDATKFQPE